MVYRIYVEKKPGFDGEAQGLCHELVDLLGIKALKGLRLINRYDVEGIDNVLFQQAIPTVFSEPPVDTTYTTLPEAQHVFAVEYLPGQFDQRADSASQCIQLLSQGERPTVRSARVYLLEGDLTGDDIAAIKKYVINPVEAREASLEERSTLKMELCHSHRGGDPGPALPPWTTMRPGSLPQRQGPGHGPRRHQVLPGLLQVRAPRPHHHRDPPDRHLLVRPLPPHHLRHHSGRRADR